VEHALARRDELAGRGNGVDDILLGLAGVVVMAVGVAAGFWAGYWKRPEPGVVASGVDPARARLAGQQHDHTWGIDGKQDGIVMVRCGICGKRKQRSEVI